MSESVVPPRERILVAALDLLERQGRTAVSTRAVSSAAGVQAPTIYRLFGDMRGLLDAVASRGFEQYLSSKTNRTHAADPVDDLRVGWDLHVEFGVSHPAIYSLIYGEPRPGEEGMAVRRASEILHSLVQRVAAAGRLRVDVEFAAQVIHAAGGGVTFSLIAMKPEDRNPNLSVFIREAVLASLTTPAPGDAPPPGGTGVVSHAVALKTALPDLADRFSAAESALLSQWLDLVARGGDPRSPR